MTESVSSEPSICMVKEYDMDTLEELAAAPVQAIKDTEYETQLLGFTPKSMSDGIYNGIYECTTEALGNFESRLKEKFVDIKVEELEAGKNIVLNGVKKTMNKAFDKFEDYVKSVIVKIPDNVLLPEDMVHADLESNYTKENEKDIDKKIEELKEQVTAQMYFNNALKKEIAEMELTQAQLDKALQNITTTEREAEQIGVPDLKEALADTSKRLTQELDQLKSTSA